MFSDGSRDDRQTANGDGSKRGRRGPLLPTMCTPAVRGLFILCGNNSTTAIASFECCLLGRPTPRPPKLLKIFSKMRMKSWPYSSRKTWVRHQNSIIRSLITLALWEWGRGWVVCDWKRGGNHSTPTHLGPLDPRLCNWKWRNVDIFPPRLLSIR